MRRAYRAEILHDLAQFWIVDVEADLVAFGSRAVDPSAGSGGERTRLTAEARDNFSPIFEHIRGRVIDEQPHAPLTPGGRGDVILAVEAESPPRQIELVAVRQPLSLHLSGSQINRVEPGGAVVFLEVNLDCAPGYSLIVSEGMDT